MRKMLAVLILGAAIVINAAAAFAGDNRDTRIFFGDGFDNTTCADTAGQRQCP